MPRPLLFARPRALVPRAASVRTLAICALLLTPSGLAQAQQAPQPLPPTAQVPVVQQDPEAVIRAQLAAISSANWELAFGYAAPAIQVRFGSPDRFAAMVQGGFGYMIDPASTQLIRLGAQDAGVLIEAIFVSRSKSVHRVLYRLEQDDAQGWRIAGVLPGQTSDLAA